MSKNPSEVRRTRATRCHPVTAQGSKPEFDYARNPCLKRHTLSALPNDRDGVSQVASHRRNWRNGLCFDQTALVIGYKPPADVRGTRSVSYGRKEGAYGQTHHAPCERRKRHCRSVKTGLAATDVIVTWQSGRSSPSQRRAGTWRRDLVCRGTSGKRGLKYVRYYQNSTQPRSEDA